MITIVKDGMVGSGVDNSRHNVWMVLGCHRELFRMRLDSVLSEVGEFLVGSGSAC